MVEPNLESLIKALYNHARHDLSEDLVAALLETAKKLPTTNEQLLAVRLSGLVCTREIADNGDIPIGNEVQNLVFSSELRCSNADADDLARYSNRTICQNDLIPHIQLMFKEDEKAIDDIRQKTLGSHTNGHPSNPSTCQQTRNWQT